MKDLKRKKNSRYVIAFNNIRLMGNRHCFQHQRRKNRKYFSKLVRRESVPLNFLMTNQIRFALIGETFRVHGTLLNDKRTFTSLILLSFTQYQFTKTAIIREPVIKSRNIFSLKQQFFVLNK